MNKIILIFIVLISTNTIKADSITITADEWCPYNCSSTDENKGFMIDLFTLVFNKAGHTVEYLISKSYEKAIINVRNNQYNAIVGVTKEEVPDFIIPETPLAYSHDVIIIAKNSTWEYISEKSLEKVILGGVKNYEYDLPIQRYIDQNKHKKELIQIVSGNRSLEYNLKKLRYQYITALIDNQLAIKYHYAQKNEPFPFKIAKTLEIYSLYIAFSPKNPKSKAYAQILSHGINELRGTKEMAGILKKYGLTEDIIISPQ